MIEPSIEAIFMENMAAIEFPHLISIPKRAQAYHTIGSSAAAIEIATIPIRERFVEIELLREDYEASETGTQEAGVVYGGFGSREEARGVEDVGEEGAEAADAVGD